MDFLEDIYFTDEYCEVYEKNGDGILTKFFLDTDEGKVIYKFLKRKIDISINDYEEYYDITTPYGYGGPLILECEEHNMEKLVQKFKSKFYEYCKENNIIAEFIRFHPIIENHRYMEAYIDISNIRSTICMDISNEDDMWNDISPTSRNKIRKAIKNNVKIDIDYSCTYLEEFLTLYEMTMKKNSAKNYYFFSREFFENNILLLKENIMIFRAILEEKCICSILVLKYGDYIHYYFSGSLEEYKNIGANNLLLYEIALWGSKNGFKKFHLGGGYSGDDDSLFKFKKSFSKNGELKFFVGKKIYNKDVYNLLVNVHQKSTNKKIDYLYFPAYRS